MVRPELLYLIIFHLSCAKSATGLLCNSCIKASFFIEHAYSHINAKKIIQTWMKKTYLFLIEKYFNKNFNKS